MQDNWLNLLKRMEEIRNNTMFTLKVYSDESGSITYVDEELMEFLSLEDLEAQIEKLEHDHKYKKFYDIVESFNRQDFYDVHNRFEDIRKRVMNDNEG